MCGDNIGGGSKAATHYDIGGGSKAASSVTLEDDNVQIKGMEDEEFLSVWRDQTGIQDLTLERVYDHQHRVDACFYALFSCPTISNDQFKKLLAEARATSYQILCNGGTSENWMYPIEK